MLLINAVFLHLKIPGTEQDDTLILEVIRAMLRIGGPDLSMVCIVNDEKCYSIR